MWIDADGEEIGEAELMKVEGVKVRLRKKDGKILEVLIDELSPSGKRYVKTGVLLAEDFFGYGIGDVTKWGRDVWVRKGADGGNWLITSLEGQHTVGVDTRLPQNFYVEFQYHVVSWQGYKGEVVPSKSDICFLDEVGDAVRIRWTSTLRSNSGRGGPGGFGQDSKKGVNASDAIDHTFELPDGAKNTVQTNAIVEQGKKLTSPTFGAGGGVIRIEKREDSIKILINGQVGIAGTLKTFKQY